MPVNLAEMIAWKIERSFTNIHSHPMLWRHISKMGVDCDTLRSLPCICGSHKTEQINLRFMI
jgi:hypothetical protein